MRITLYLDRDDAVFLLTQLERHVAEIEDELVHTDSRDLQRALAGDAAKTKRIAAELARRVEAYDEEDRFFDESEEALAGLPS